MQELFVLLKHFMKKKTYKLIQIILVLLIIAWTDPQAYVRFYEEQKQLIESQYRTQELLSQFSIKESLQQDQSLWSTPKTNTLENIVSLID